jgi:hypothetical protein
MTHKPAIILLSTLILSLAAWAEPAPQAAFDAFKECWTKLEQDSIKRAPFEKCWSDFLHAGNIGPYAEQLQKMATAGLKPGKPFLLRLESLDILSLFQNDENFKLFQELTVKRDTLYIRASKTLLKWGDWKTAAPVLEHFKMYSELLGDPRGASYLYALLDSGDAGQRVAAAKAIYQDHKQPDSLRLALRSVLAMPPDKRDAAVTKQVVDLLRPGATDSDVQSMVNIVESDTSHATRLVAFSALVLLAYQEHPAALAGLEKISQDCPDADLRAKSATYVQTVKKLKEKAADSLKASGK